MYLFYIPVRAKRKQVYSVRLENKGVQRARVSSRLERGATGSNSDQMDMKRELHHSLQISKHETYCRFPFRDKEGDVLNRNGYK